MHQGYLEKIYYDPRHPGSLGGVEKLYKAVRKEGKYILERPRSKNGWTPRKRSDYTDRSVASSADGK